MANMHASSALWIGERPDLTVLVSDTGGARNVIQAEGVTLKLHKSVLGEYEYFKQRFDAQPDVSEQGFRRGTYCHVRIILTLISWQMEVLDLPKSDIKIRVVVDMLEYLYTQSTETIERGLARSEMSYSKYHLDLFQLSLRFYVPELEKIATDALDQEEIGIQDGSFGKMECLIADMYENRRGKKWEILRQMVMKRQAWKLIKLPIKTMRELDERFPGFQCELAEAWRPKLEESVASKGSFWTCRRK